ncbi:MAG: GAF domain-containing protein [Pseudomonadota bacterium]
MAFDVFHPNCAAFIVFDELTGEAVIQAVARRLKVGTRYPLHNSVVGEIRNLMEVVHVADMTELSLQSSEHSRFGFRSVLAAPVEGPDGEPIGALAVFDATSRDWPSLDHERLSNLAYLITQEVILCASFATLELMATERHA